MTYICFSLFEASNDNYSTFYITFDTRRDTLRDGGGVSGGKTVLQGLLHNPYTTFPHGPFYTAVTLLHRSRLLPSIPLVSLNQMCAHHTSLRWPFASTCSTDPSICNSAIKGDGKVTHVVKSDKGAWETLLYISYIFCFQPWWTLKYYPAWLAARK